jgi:hypothetical protein
VDCLLSVIVLSEAKISIDLPLSRGAVVAIVFNNTVLLQQNGAGGHVSLADSLSLLVGLKNHCRQFCFSLAAINRFPCPRSMP